MSNRKLSGPEFAGGCAAILALAAFVAVVVVIVGGWVFSMSWNNFLVPVVGASPIEITDGIWAMLGLYISGWALGLRGGFRGNGKKVD